MITQPSIFTGLPSWLILIGIALLVASLSVTFYAKNWVAYIGLAIFVAINLSVLLLPVIRGYYLPIGQWDSFEHVGYVRSLLEGHIGGVGYFNPYPGLHVLPAALVRIFSIQPNTAVMLTPAIFGLVYIGGMYWVSILLFDMRLERLVATALASCLIVPYFGELAHIGVVLLFPVYIGVVISIWQKRSLHYYAWLGLLLLASVFLHPQLLEASLILMAITAIYAWVLKERAMSLAFASVFIIAIPLGLMWMGTYNNADTWFTQLVSSVASGISNGAIQQWFWKIDGVLRLGIIDNLPWQQYFWNQFKFAFGEILLVTVALIAGIVILKRFRDSFLAVLSVTLIAFIAIFGSYWLFIRPLPIFQTGTWLSSQLIIERLKYFIPVLAIPLAAWAIGYVIRSVRFSEFMLVIFIAIIALGGFDKVHAMPYSHFTYQEMARVERVIDASDIILGRTHLSEITGYPINIARKLAVAIKGHYWYGEHITRMETLRGKV